MTEAKVELYQMEFWATYGLDPLEVMWQALRFAQVEQAVNAHNVNAEPGTHMRATFYYETNDELLQLRVWGSYAAVEAVGYRLIKDRERNSRLAARLVLPDRGAHAPVQVPWH